MKVALTLAGIAMLTLGGSANAAAPAAPGNGRFCLKNPNTHTINCSYMSKARCDEVAAAGNGACSANPKWAARAHRSTTGSATAK